jgi:hypothetical protein
LYRASANALFDRLRIESADTTIRPSACIATPKACAPCRIKVVTAPSEPNVVSGEPSELYLATASFGFALAASATPATTIFPSG